MPKSDIRKYDLEERTARFGKAVLTFVRSIRVDVVTRPLISQIVRSATSIGANYSEASDAQSRNDFRHIIALCRKESRETGYWLNMISHVVPELNERTSALREEARQLNDIFGASLKTLAKSV